MITFADSWTGTRGAGLIGVLPDNWEEALEESSRRLEMSREAVNFLVSPALLARAWTHLLKAFADDASAIQELQQLTVDEVIEWYLDL